MVLVLFCLVFLVFLDNDDDDDDGSKKLLVIVKIVKKTIEDDLTNIKMVTKVT